MKNRILLVVLALWFPAILAARGRPSSVARAAETAPVGTLTIGDAGSAGYSGFIGWSSAAPVGTCSNCARPVYEAFSGLKNSRVTVSDRSFRTRFDGCFDCLFEILDAAKKPKESK